MNVAVTLSPREYDVVLFDLEGCIVGQVFGFVSDTSRFFRLNDDATDGRSHRDVTGDAP